jgi:hypothetical protein
MSGTTFIPNVTVIRSSWLNPINDFAYNGVIPSDASVVPGGSGYFPISTGTNNFTWTNVFPASTVINSITGTGIVANTGTALIGRTILGTTDRISIDNPNGVASNPAIDIAITYAGQTSITTLGTITTGTWNANTVSVQFGGTGVTSYTPHCVLMSGATSTSPITNLGPASSGALLMSKGASFAPTWTDAIYPQSVSENSILYASAPDTIDELTTINNAVLVTNGSGVPSFSTTLPSGVLGNITTLGTVTTGVWNATPITVAYGGTGATSLTANSLVLSGATSTSALTTLSSGTSGQLLRSAGAGSAPSWTTATFPTTTTANQLLYSSANNVVGGLTSAANAVLTTSSGSVPSWTSSLPSAVMGNITTVGTVTSGTWNGSIISGTYGGTGVNNGTKTITLGGNLTTSGAFNTTLTATATTNVTLPTSGTLVETTNPMLARVYGNVVTTSASAVISQSSGVSSITYNGVGDITVNLSSAMSTASYEIIATAKNAGGGAAGTVVVQEGSTSAKSTTAFNLIMRNVSGTNIECRLYFAVVGN